MTTPGTTYDELADPEVYIDTGALDCVQTALNRLYYQWQGQPNWQSLMRVAGEVVQRLETLSLGILTQMHIATATGVQLDKIGEFVGLERGSLSDDDLFRLAIIAKGAALTSSGTVDELIGILATLFPNNSVNVIDAPPANIIVTVSGPALDLSLVEFVSTIFLPAVSAGVGFVFSATDTDLVGGWSSSTGAAPPGTALGVWSSSTGPNPTPDPLSLWPSAI